MRKPLIIVLFAVILSPFFSPSVHANVTENRVVTWEWGQNYLTSYYEWPTLFRESIIYVSGMNTR